jgi:hypothetical protein
MERTRARQFLDANVDRTVKVHWSDGFNQEVTVLTVDDEGFVYEPNSKNPEGPFWTSFDDVSHIAAPKQGDSTKTTRSDS